MAISFDSTVIARVAAGLYGLQIGNQTMNWALQQISNGTTVKAIVNDLYARDFGARSTADVAAQIVANVGITGAAATAEAVAIVKATLDTTPAAQRGAAVVDLMNAFAGLTTNPVYGTFATAFNNQTIQAVNYAQTPGTADRMISSIIPQIFVQAETTALGADVMRLTGNQFVRIDFTDPANQIKGLDLNGNGVIDADGVENNITGRAANFEIVDAYPRNPLNQKDTANNFLGDIRFDGTGFDGDGVSTDGNVVLGGLGVDTIFGGVGNDFLTGGGVAATRSGTDYLSGGRNADFFFAEFAPIDRTDGKAQLEIDGGATADDNSAGSTQSSQDADWLLFEATDDDEPVSIWLNDDNTGYDSDGLDGLFDDKGRVLSRSGQSMVLDDVEHVDASGNLYGLLNDVDVEIGARAIDTRDAASPINYGIGSSAQLRIVGSDGVGNILIGGYDNDSIDGRTGSDLLMGGNLQFFLETVTGGVVNPNLSGIKNDGRDELIGGEGDDNIVFEADGGVITGGADSGVAASFASRAGGDTLWLTKYSLGTGTAASMTTDGRLRFDLTSENGITEGLAAEGGAGYGGANRGTTADQTNYATGITGGAVTVTGMESIDATGLGAIDFKAAGANTPELTFTNQQNFKGYNGDLQLLGSQVNNNIYSGAGNDEIHGRGGSDDMQGGRGNDDFYFAIDGDFTVGGSGTGDGVDIIRRKVDANGDDLWDTTSTGAVVWGQDFGLDQDATTGSSVLRIAIQRAGGNPAGTQLNQVVNFVSEIVTGVKVGTAFVPITLNTTDIKAATTYAGLTNAINAALDATPYGADLQATLQSDGFTIFITDAKGRELADQTSEVPGAGVSVNQIANTATENSFVFGAPTVTLAQDRLIYKAWEDRNDNEAVNDASTNGSAITLGADAYAEDLVISFQADGTRIAEDQSYTVAFVNVTTQDRVTVSVNGVRYTLTVGVDLDGNPIAAEDGVGDAQVDIQNAFLTRLADFITNSFTDDDTVAGKVDATFAGGVFTINQREYNGEDTVFMRTPVVTIENISGGQAATATVTNTSQHEVHLFQFDGRDNKLNDTNVLFWGSESIQRANLETSKNAGGRVEGTEAIVVDMAADNLQSAITNGTKAAILNNTATNAVLVNDFAAHGDDFLLGGAGIDQIFGGTGDDRVVGSVGSATAPTIGGTDGERADGGKNFYAIQVLGEAQARVYILNKWEAANPSQVAELAGLTISSISLINQAEAAGAVAFTTNSLAGNGVFDDTLQFQQEDFNTTTAAPFGNTARFTITLDDFAVAGGVVQTRNDGAGLVGVDADGDGTIESYTRFTNFENIRTVSGTGNAVAGDGQGNDTLNVTAMSLATAGVSYDLTNRASAGEVKYSANAHASLLRPAEADFESLVIRVDGVENVIGGDGDDLLMIDETEAAKNNAFDGGLGDDRIEYLNVFGGANPLAAEPTVTIRVNTSANVDQVVSTAGRLGTVVATDTLTGVEFITIAGNTAQSTRENDVLDVSAMTGAIVNYNDLVQSSAVTGTGIGASGTVRDTSGNIQVTVENLFQVERVVGSAGGDTLILADADAHTLNTNEDVGDATPAADITFSTFIDFDELSAVTATLNKRIPFLSQTPAQRVDVVNNGQYSFEAGAGSDTADYSLTADAISVVVELDETRPTQFVLVDGDGVTFNGDGAPGTDLTEATDRIDVLRNVERIVASQNESVLDLTSSTKGVEIKFSEFVLADRVAATATLDSFDVTTVRISDLSSATPLSRAYVEYRDVADAVANTIPDRVNATWNRIEGSDNAERVILNSAHSVDNDTFNLRGGANEVKYNELTRSITTTLRVEDFVAANPLGTVATGYAGSLYASGNPAAANQQRGTVMAITQFQDGNGAALAGGGTHVVTSYTANNAIPATGTVNSLRIAASQDAEDTLEIAGDASKLFILSEAGTTDNQITVRLGSGAATNSVILTGYEFVQDAASNDLFDIGNLNTTLIGLTITDNGAADHDGIRVRDDSIGFNSGVANTIDLDAISSDVDGADVDTRTGFNFDFDVLDVTLVTAGNLVLSGGSNATPVNADLDATDEVVLGVLSRVNSINEFEAVVLTEASVAAGTSFTFRPGVSLVQGSTTVTLDAAAVNLSFGGLILENALRGGLIADVTTGVTATVVGTTAAQLHGGAGNDTLTGGGAGDTIRGNGGADTLDGGTSAEIRTVQLDGITDADAGDSVTLTFDADGGGAGTYAVTVTAGVEYTAGAGSDAIGAALATKISAELAALNAAVSAADPAWNGGASLVGVSFNAATDLLTFTFSTGVNVTGTIVTGTTEGGTFAISTESTTTEGGDGGADTFVFEPTAAGNGSDVINNFVAANGASDDLLDFTAFLGGVSTTAGAAADFAGAGLSLLANNTGVVFNKTGGTLAAGDIQLTAAAGKIAVPDNGKVVVLVSADVDGVSDATINAYNVYYVEDTNAVAGGAGNQTYTVTLVGTLNSATELDAANFFAGTDAFV